jgi:hypothetical protein
MEGIAADNTEIQLCFAKQKFTFLKKATNHKNFHL